MPIFFALVDPTNLLNPAEENRFSKSDGSVVVSGIFTYLLCKLILPNNKKMWKKTDDFSINSSLFLYIIKHKSSTYVIKSN